MRRAVSVKCCTSFGSRRLPRARCSRYDSHLLSTWYPPSLQNQTADESLAVGGAGVQVDAERSFAERGRGPGNGGSLFCRVWPIEWAAGIRPITTTFDHHGH